MRRGGRELAAIFVVYLFAEVSVLTLQVEAASLSAIPSIRRLAAGVILFFVVWRGARWAAYALAGAFTIVALAAVGVIVFDVWPLAADVVIGVEGVLALVGARLLAFGPAIRAYQEHQRG